MSAALASSTGVSSAMLSSSTSELSQRSSTPLRMRHPDYTQSSPPPAESEESDSSSNEYSDSEATAVDDDNYVRKTLAREKPLPPITLKNWYREINVISTLALTIVPALAFYGAMTVEVQMKTVIWSIIYYYFSGLGITAGYHRLWAHRSYTASKPLQYFLACGGSASVEGSIKWWSRGHRAHHRYTDTELDPYSAHKGLLWSHVGWMIVKPRRKPGVADVSDLSKNEVVIWQHKYYLPLIIGMGFLLPTAVAGLGWGDWKGGFFFAGAARLLFVHHSTFCVNSLAHWLGDTPFDAKHSPRDSWIVALLTIGEGYHNFHHEFPQDFRNAIEWFQYDPTKWFICAAFYLGLASQLKKFPDNEVAKGRYAMSLRKLQQQSEHITWPTESNNLPILTWDEFAEQSKTRSLIVISGFIHDVTSFIEDHPGGKHWIKARIGKDASTAFYGGVYDHSNGANALLAMFRVGCIQGGYEIEALKKYSQIIHDLAEFGGAGVGGKDSDLGGAVRRTVEIKDNGNPHVITAEPFKPNFDATL